MVKSWAAQALFGAALTIVAPALAAAQPGQTLQTPASQSSAAPSVNGSTADGYVPPPRGAPDGRISGGTRGVHGPSTAGTPPVNTTRATGSSPTPATADPKVKRPPAP